MSISTIQIDGIEMQLHKRRGVKRISIKVMPPDAQVKVVSPKRASQARIREVILMHLEKIRETVRNMKASPYFEGEETEEEELVFLWGNRFKLILKEADKESIVIENSSMIMNVREGLLPISQEEKRKRLNAFYRKELKRALPQIAAKYEAIVEAKPYEYRIKDMRTRWGTCNIEKKRIWLSLQLAKKPVECLEYVVVHELVHLLERHHNKRFYGFMDRFYPQWKQVGERLKNN